MMDYNMIFLYGILYFAIGYLIACFFERYLYQGSAANDTFLAAQIGWPMLLIAALIFSTWVWCVRKSLDIKPSKLRKYIRGF